MILVTGGTGLVGAHVLFELVNGGHSVRALKRKTSSYKVVKDIFNFYSPNGEGLFSGINWVEGDLDDTGSIEKAVKGCEVVFHCAALVSFNPADFKQLLKVNQYGTANFIDICNADDVKEFYYVSSVAALGKNPETQEVDEVSEWEHSKDNSGYAISKYLGELEVWRGGEEGLKVAIVNPTLILGPGRTYVSSGTIFKSIAAGQKYYTLGQNGYVDARDVAFVLKRLFDEKLFGARYLLCGEHKTFKEIGELMATHLGVTAPSVLAKPWMTSLGWRLFWVWSKLTGKPPLLTKETARSSHRKSVFVNSKVRSELGMTFRTAEQAIKNSAAFFRAFPEHL
jgi:nucleoside-diphosphate-sugar epimerase